MTADEDRYHSVGVFVDEGSAFVDRHEHDLGTEAATAGGFIWGFMRAVAECPDCPGVFRIPVGKRLNYESDWDVLWCPRCQHGWFFAAEPAQPDPAQPSLFDLTA